LLKRRAELPRKAGLPAGKEAAFAAALDALACAEDAWRNRQPAEAVEKLLGPALSPAVPLGPAHALRGQLSLGRGRLARALEDAEKAITLSPEDAGGYLVRGRVRLERAAPGALADLQKAAELSGKQDADVLQALAEALAAAGRLEEAVQAARLASKLRPQDRDLLEQLRHLEQARKKKRAG
jgi:tetratricopeptide (TPR) repeat protein